MSLFGVMADKGTAWVPFCCYTAYKECCNLCGRLWKEVSVLLVSIETDYALSILCLIARKAQGVNSTEIIRTVGGSREYINKLLLRLKHAELIEHVKDDNSIKGICYVLCRRPKEVSMLDIVNVTEKTMRISRNLGKDSGLCHTAIDKEKANVIFDQIRSDIIKRFRDATIADFI